MKKGLKPYEIGWALKPVCPHCGKESGRTWLLNGLVECWECKKTSKYEEWY